MFDVSEDEQLGETFDWENAKPLLKKGHSQRGAKLNFLDYQSQFLKAYQFIKLIGEEGFN